MRVLIEGDCPTAKALRGLLARHDFHLTEHRPHLTIQIDEQPGATHPCLASCGGELERAILHHLRRQTSTPIEIHTAQSGEEVCLVVPPAEQERRAAEVAAFRALLELSFRRDEYHRDLRLAMQPTFLGKVAVVAVVTPVAISTDPTARACAILVATIPGLTSNFLGGAELNQTTLQGVIIQFNAQTAQGPPDQFLLASKDARNSLCVADYFLDASVSGEGALVTYFQT